MPISTRFEIAFNNYSSYSLRQQQQSYNITLVAKSIQFRAKQLENERFILHACSYSTVVFQHWRGEKLMETTMKGKSQSKISYFISMQMARYVIRIMWLYVPNRELNRGIAFMIAREPQHVRNLSRLYSAPWMWMWIINTDQGFNAKEAAHNLPYNCMICWFRLQRPFAILGLLFQSRKLCHKGWEMLSMVGILLTITILEKLTGYQIYFHTIMDLVKMLLGYERTIIGKTTADCSS